MEELIESLTVLVKCDREDDIDFHEQGTGVLIHTNHEEYDYVITAYHCLAGPKQHRHGYNIENITIEHEKLNNLEVLHSYDNEELDISIIKIKKMNIKLPINLYKEKEKKRICIVAYPNSQVEKMKVEGKLSFRGRIEKYTENFKEILMRIDPEDMNIVRDSQKKMAGCSGAGVFIQSHTSIQLAGILTDVGDEENPFNILNATKIEEIERFIADKELIPIDYMRDKKILDFKDSCFKELRKDELKESLKDYIDEFTDLKVVDIIDWLGEKVIFPCIGEKYNDYNLWTSWCEFIALMVIYSNFEYGETVEQLLDYLKDHRENHTKFYYSYASELADIVREIYSDKFHDTIYTKCKQNNNILVDFKADKFAITYLESDKVSKIVRSISTVNCTKKNRITSPKVNKNLNFIHMDLLRERISKGCSFIDNKDDIKETVSTIVREVLNNVGNR